MFTTFTAELSIIRPERYDILAESPLQTQITLNNPRQPLSTMLSMPSPSFDLHMLSHTAIKITFVSLILILIVINSKVTNNIAVLFFI